ncbi:MAG: hypothetical protein ACYTKC_10055 [Planctomycetota bacterium]|jgi:hypothetical protein
MASEFARSTVLLSSAVAVAAAVLALPATAQTRIYNADNVATTGSCNVIPFGSIGLSTTWSNQKYQSIVPASKFGSKVGAICSLGFAACATGIKKFQTIEIKMDYFQGTGSTLTTTFSNNISSKAVTVLSAKNYVFHTTQGQWSHVGLQRPFLYVPNLGHLVVQVTVTGAEGSGYNFRTGNSATSGGFVPRLYAFGGTWVGGVPPAKGTLNTQSGLKMEIGFDAASLDTFGVGCPGSNTLTPALTLSGSSALGKSLTVSLANALPNAGVFFVVGLGVTATPTDMAPFGAPNCSIFTSLDLILPTTANASGALSSQFTVPNVSTLVCTKIYVQFFPHDKQANAFGASSSNYGRVLVGR